MARTEVYRQLFTSGMGFVNIECKASEWVTRRRWFRGGERSEPPLLDLYSITQLEN